MNDQAKPTILVVDDNPSNLQFLFLALKREAFQVELAKNGQIALEMAQKQPPDLILLDIMMPGIDGFETCRRLKENKATQAIPVIFMTALSDTVDKLKGFSLGAADYVTKPTDLAEVIARVRTHVQLHRLQQDLRVRNERLLEENEKRRRVQDALRESRRRYRLLAENSNDIISRQSLQGVYSYVSPACRTLLGYKIEEMIGCSLTDFVHPEDVEEVRRLTRPHEVEQPTAIVTYRATRKDGGFIWLETLSKTVFDPQTDLPDETVSVSRDVTERVELTEQLRERNDELDAFAHTVAHDLKNPLGGIVSTTDFLLAAWSRLDEDKKFHFIRNTRDLSRKSIDIIGELLLLSSVRREEIELDVIDPGELVENVQRRLDQMITQTNAEVVLPDRWPAALGYGPWVEEIWVNYVSNAVKYGGSPPRLKLGGVEQPNGTVKFWVRDNGPGLSAEAQAQLFTEFNRLGELRVEGHGLGLSIVRRIAEKLGGEVGVQSQVGYGSEFFFTLPAPGAAFD